MITTSRKSATKSDLPTEENSKDVKCLKSERNDHFMTVFISGGVKNGKSYHAQQIAKKLSGDGPLYYLATMISHDKEDEERINRHIKDRDGMGFQTIECPRDIKSCLEKANTDGVFLLDSSTALLSNEMFLDDGSVNLSAAEKIAGELCDLAEKVGGLVVVSDTIYSDAVRYDELTEEYRRGLAHIDKALARCFGTVLEICGGTVFCHKGALNL